MVKNVVNELCLLVDAYPTTSVKNQNGLSFGPPLPILKGH